MKKFQLIVIGLLCLLVLSGCCLKHDWLEANCTDPITCSKCGKTEGEALGHTWVDPDCVTPKTCSVCAATEGEALGHTWLAANCQTPETCEVCGATQGELGDHVWLDATTETPKTCSLCAVTEGERIITDERFTTDACKDFFGIWMVSYTFTGKQLGLDGFIEEVPCTLYLKFEPNGKLDVAGKAVDEETFLAAVVKLTEDFIYGTYESREAAEAEILETSGMTVTQYAEKMAPRTAESLFDDYINAGVYFIADGQYHYARSWTAAAEASDFTLEDGTLVIRNLFVDEGTPLVWTKAK